MRGRRSSHPALLRARATPATQAHLEALDGAGVASTGPAGVIVSSWRYLARAERRAAADRTCLLHFAAAARSVRDPRLQSGPWEVSLRTDFGSIRALSVTYMHMCMHMYM